MAFYMCEVAVRSHRFDDSFLLCRSSGDFFIDNTEPDKIHIERNVRGVRQAYMQKQ